MKSKLFLLLALSAFVLGACAKGGTSDQSSVAPAPSSETTSTSESSEQSSEQSSEESSESESSSEEPGPAPISEVTVSGISTPVLNGQTYCDFTIDNEGVAFSQSSSYWFEHTEEGDTFYGNSTVLKEFQANHTYGVIVSLYTTGEANFAEDVEIKLNLDGIVVPFDSIEDISYYKQAKITFDPIAPATIGQVDFENLVVPEADALADLTSVVLKDDRYVTINFEKTYWGVINDFANNEAFAYIDDEKSFETGYRYFIFFTIEAVVPFEETLAVTINGEAPERRETAITIDDKTATIRVYFDEIDGIRHIHKVFLSYIPQPVVGEVAPRLNTIYCSPSKYAEIDLYNAYWVYFTGETSTYFFSDGDDDTRVFSAGVRYAIKIVIESYDTDCYAFADDLVIYADGEEVTYEKCGTDDVDRRAFIVFDELA